MALAWFVVGALHKPEWLAPVLVASTAPQFILGLPGGLIVDRFPRRAVVVTSNLVSAGALAALGTLALAGVDSLASVLALVTVTSAAQCTRDPSLSALMPTIVSADQLGRAASLRTACEQAAGVLGPALAGVLVAVAGAPVWFLVDAATFVVAAAMVAGLKPASPGRRPGSEGRRDEGGILAGFTLLRTVPWLRHGVLAGALANLLLVAPISLLIPILLTRTGSDARALGYFGTCFAIGTLSGALAAGRLTAPRRLSRAVAALAIAGALAAGLGIPATLPTLLLAGLTVGALLASFEVLWDSRLLSGLDTRLLGRALSVDLWLSLAFRSAGMLVLGAIAAEHARTGLVVSSGVLVVAAALMLPAVRRDESRPSGYADPAPAAS